MRRDKFATPFFWPIFDIKLGKMIKMANLRWQMAPQPHVSYTYVINAYVLGVCLPSISYLLRLRPTPARQELGTLPLNSSA